MTISHFACRERVLLSEIKDKSIPVTKAHCDLLNGQILRFVDVPPNKDDIEQLSDLLRTVTELAANVSFVFSHISQRVKIKDLRKGQEEIARRDGESKLAARAEEARKIQRQTERANPAIRDRRKAIEGFRALGLSEEQAIAAVDKMRATERT